MFWSYFIWRDYYPLEPVRPDGFEELEPVRPDGFEELEPVRPDGFEDGLEDL